MELYGTSLGLLFQSFILLVRSSSSHKRSKGGNPTLRLSQRIGKGNYGTSYVRVTYQGGVMFWSYVVMLFQSNQEIYL